MMSASKVINKETGSQAADPDLLHASQACQHLLALLTPWPGSWPQGGCEAAEKNICPLQRKQCVQKTSPNRAPDLGALKKTLSRRRGNVKMYQLIYVNISVAEYAENESRRIVFLFYSMLYMIQMNSFI